MKNLKTIFCTLLFVVAFSAFSQTATHVTKLDFDNITNCRLRYYYYPNLEAYYDKEKGLYLYKENNEWKSGTEIPSGYRGYGLYNKVNIAIYDYDDDDVTQFFTSHKKKYPYNSLKKMRGATASVE